MRNLQQVCRFSAAREPVGDADSVLVWSCAAGSRLHGFVCWTALLPSGGAVVMQPDPASQTRLQAVSDVPVVLR